MPRNFGRFTTSIWRDADFVSLTQPLQAVYFMLGTQPDVSAAGTLPLTTGRWAKFAAGATRALLDEQVAALMNHPARHVIADDDTQELMIRKFMKWDGGWSNSKRLPVILEAVDAISSVHIRDTAVDELRKLAASPATSEDGKRSRDALSDAISRFDRLRVTEVGNRREPGTRNQEPLSGNLEGEPPTIGASADPPPMFCTKHPNGTEDPCGPCADARKRYAAWAEAKTARELEARRAATEARRACRMCDEKGVRLDPKTRLPVGRCDHIPDLVESEAS